MTGPRTKNREEAVEIFRNIGLVGAGGAGFPTYFKYLTPVPTLIVNAEEGEPGFEADKLILRKFSSQFEEIFRALKEIFGFKNIYIGAKEKDRKDLEYLEDRFDIRYTENRYGMGEERWLTKALTGIQVPPNKFPPEFGVLVSNVETVHNMYQALFLAKPVTAKYFNLYGEVAEQCIYLAPVGAYVEDLLEINGTTLDSPNLMVMDGGPMMCGQVDPAVYGIKKTTNGLLVVDRYFKERGHATWRDTGEEIMETYGISQYLNWDPEPEEIQDVREEIERVKPDLRQGIGKPSVPVVTAGEKVKEGQLIAAPLKGKIEDFEVLSVGLHASIDGMAAEVTEEYITIER